MIRRSVLALTAIALLGGFASNANASGINEGTDDGGRHYVCVMGGESPNSPSKGLCVWIPTT